MKYKDIYDGNINRQDSYRKGGTKGGEWTSLGKNRTPVRTGTAFLSVLCGNVMPPELA